MGKDERDSVMAFGEIFFAALEVAGTISFAISGAMAALEKRVICLELFSLEPQRRWPAALPDVLVGKTPPAAFSNYRYMAIAAITAVVVFFIAWLSKEHYEHNVAVVNAVNNVFDAGWTWGFYDYRGEGRNEYGVYGQAFSLFFWRWSQVSEAAYSEI